MTYIQGNYENHITDHYPDLDLRPFSLINTYMLFFFEFSIF